MPTKTRHNFVSLIAPDDGAAAAWEMAVVDQLAPEAEAVLVKSEDLVDGTQGVGDGLCILRSPSDSIVKIALQSCATVILLTDSAEASWPESWIVLPANASPLNVAKVARLKLRDQAQAGDQGLASARMDLATYSHGCSIWENILQLDFALDQLETLPQWMRQGARFLEGALYGARVVQIAVQDGENGHSLLTACGKLSPADRSFARKLDQGPHLVIDTTAAHEFRFQLTRSNADLIVAIRGGDRLLGWFLLAFADHHQVFLNKPLAEKMAQHLGSLLNCRTKIRELASFRHAIREGLDELETGITILNKEGDALVENKAAREASRKLGCRSAHLLSEVHRAIQKARSGHPTETILANYCLRASAWGSLNNGCVLQTRQRFAERDACAVSLEAWLKECADTAKSFDLELSLGVGSDLLPTLVGGHDDLRLESLCLFLSDENFVPRIVVGCERTPRSLLIHFDQEFREGKLQPETPSSPPFDANVSYASLGRRVALDFPVCEAVTNSPCCGNV